MHHFVVVLDGGLVPCILDRGVGTPRSRLILILYCLMRTGSRTYYISLVLLIELGLILYFSIIDPNSGSELSYLRCQTHSSDTKSSIWHVSNRAR